MRAPRSALAVCGFWLLLGCRKHEPQKQPIAADPRPAVPSASGAPLAVAAPFASVPPRASATSPGRTPSRAPVALDADGRRTAAAYVTALGQGRKATVAKDYARAEAQLSKCLELLPRDARALAERGYARLLAGKLEEAEADLATAAETSPSSSLSVQILHNRMLAARKRGDDKAALSFEKAKQQLVSARRINARIGCDLQIAPSKLEPEHPKTLAEALSLMFASHAREARIEAAQVTLGSEALPPGASDAELWKLATGDTPRDGAWVLTTNGPDEGTKATHLLIARGSKLYLHPRLSLGWLGRCGYSGAAEVKVAGGAAEPLHVTLLSSENMVGYMCEWPDGHQPAACGTRGEVEGTPVQSYCGWASTTEQLIVFDATGFEGLLDVNATAQATDEGVSSEPTQLLEFRLEAERVAIDACGAHQLVPYHSPDP